MLEESTTPIVEAHDLVMFDLDGVVYVGGEAIAGVAERIERLRETGRHIAFVTNNASRTPAQVADKLVGVGVRASGTDVVTSAQAAARVLVDEHGTGAKVLVLGGEGLLVALVEAGLEPVDEPKGAVAVVSGYGPDVRWRDIMRVSTLVRDGLPYVASNADLTIPTAYGLAPGHGVLVRTITGFAGVPATVAGKPEKPLMEETVRRVGGDQPIMVGDRLDTDIEGAHAIGVPSLLVLTGVTWLEELAAATPELRPTYISPTLEGLFEPHPVPTPAEPGVQLGGWTAAVVDGRLDRRRRRERRRLVARRGDRVLAAPRRVREPRRRLRHEPARAAPDARRRVGSRPWKTSPDEQPHGHGGGHHEGVGSPEAGTAPRSEAVDYEPTGVESVDRVLADVAAVADAPIGDHVQVFERAHEQLRRALDAHPDPAGDARDA